MADSFIDALLALPVMGRAVVSPDGRLVAWSWYRKAPAADIYLAPTDGTAAANEKPRRLTATPDDTVLVSWAPDSTPLTEASPPFFARGGELSADGRYLIFAANLDPATGAAIEASWVIRQDLASGARIALAKPAKPHSFRPLLNKAGTQILYSRR